MAVATVEAATAEVRTLKLFAMMVWIMMVMEIQMTQILIAHQLHQRTQIAMIPMSYTLDTQTIFLTPTKKLLTEPLAIGFY